MCQSEVTCEESSQDTGGNEPIKAHDHSVHREVHSSVMALVPPTSLQIYTPLPSTKSVLGPRWTHWITIWSCVDVPESRPVISALSSHDQIISYKLIKVWLKSLSQASESPPVSPPLNRSGVGPTGSGFHHLEKQRSSQSMDLEWRRCQPSSYIAN